MNNEGNFEATLWLHRWRHHHEKYFLEHILGRSFHIWGKIAAVFSISKFSKWPAFSGRDNFFYRMLYRQLLQDSHEYFRYFELLIDALAQILTEIYQFQILPTLWPGDVINDVMNTRLYKCNHNLLLPMHRTFNDDIFARFLVSIKNVVISFLKKYIGLTFKAPCDVIGDVIIMKKKPFYGIIWDDLFISEVKLKLCLMFQDFQNGHHFEFATHYFSVGDARSWIYQKDSH